MYVDSVVDGMLKGLDQQLFAFRCNLADSLLRVAAVAVLLPLWGMAGYAAVLFFSEIFNASLSILPAAACYGARRPTLSSGCFCRGRSRSAYYLLRSASLCRVARRAAHLPPAASVRFCRDSRPGVPFPAHGRFVRRPDGFLLF